MVEKIVIIGGSSGIGLAVAARLLDDGAEVTIAGRSAVRLAAAREALRAGDDRLHELTLDIGDVDGVRRSFEQMGSIDHLVVTAGDLPYGPVAALTETDVSRAVRSKVVGPLFAAREASRWMSNGSSITVTAGVAAHRPMPGGAVAAIVNGALESMVRALALELAPIRVNAVSPGWVDTPIWDGMTTSDAKAVRFEEMSARLPGKRTASPSDIAEVFSFLMHCAAMTGTVLHAEAGQLLV